jgi:hypothetical protein
VDLSEVVEKDRMKGQRRNIDDVLMDADDEDVRFEQRDRGNHDAVQSTARMGKEWTIIGTVSLYIDFFTNHILCECLDSLSLCRQPIRAP